MTNSVPMIIDTIKKYITNSIMYKIFVALSFSSYDKQVIQLLIQLKSQPQHVLGKYTSNSPCTTDTNLVSKKKEMTTINTVRKTKTLVGVMVNNDVMVYCQMKTINNCRRKTTRSINTIM